MHQHTFHRTFSRTLATAGLALAVTLGAAGCGDDSTTDPGTSQTSATDHSEADVAFATDMIQHHAQALSMVDLTIGRTLDPQVQALAEDIRAAQAPEIETMVDWLTSWDEEVPETVRDHANAEHGSSSTSTDMPGMMSAEDMEALEDAPDAEFQTMWLEMMVEHHSGALEMAKSEQDGGTYGPAVALAGSIIESQSAEIEQMESLLEDLDT